MACHEIAALRLGLMKVLGIDDPSGEEHELKELGAKAHQEGALKSLCKSNNMEELLNFFNISITELQEKISFLPQTDPSLPYNNTLLVLNRRIEQDLQNRLKELKRLYEDLDEIHHLVHDIYPAPK